MKNIFITGASGFVGQFLVKRLLQTTPDRLYLLMRKKKNESAIERCKELFANYQDLIGDRIILVEGELEQAKFGLNEQKFNELASGINTVFHTAATIKFDLPYKEAYAINVDGTRHCLLLAKRAGKALERFHHVSTAYVNRSLAGDQERNYNNTYEQTKYEAELLFQQSPDIPYTIYRPSIVSGCSETGELAPSSIIYKFIVLLSRNLIDVLPLDASTELNFIPVNNFVDEMLAIGKQSISVNNTYPITHHENTNFPTLLKLSAQLLRVKAPQFIPMDRAAEVPLKIMRQIKVLWPYFYQSQQFEIPKYQLDAIAHKPFDDVQESFHLIIENYLGKHKEKMES